MKKCLNRRNSNWNKVCTSICHFVNGRLTRRNSKHFWGETDDMLEENTRHIFYLETWRVIAEKVYPKIKHISPDKKVHYWIFKGKYTLFRCKYKITVDSRKLELSGGQKDSSSYREFELSRNGLKTMKITGLLS